MSQSETFRQTLTEGDYELPGSSRKLALLLQRSFRYSYRQRCCVYCPTIICEFLFPIMVLGLLVLSRYASNKMLGYLDQSNATGLSTVGRRCSPDLNISPASSHNLFAKCFQFPSSYKESYIEISHNSNKKSNKTNLVFQPITADVDELVNRASKRLLQMNCAETKVWSQNPDGRNNSYLLESTTQNTIIIDFSETSDIKKQRKLVYSIIVRTSNLLLKNTPVDTSFISFGHPSFIPDRSTPSDSNDTARSELPEFADVKMFVDSLLVEYQTNRSIQFELERNVMICTPIGRDFLITANLLSKIVFLIDIMFAIPYILLLTSLIREKNAKVKEILKILGIEPILNNIAHAIRIIIILFILTIFLCVVLKLKLDPVAYFNTVSYGILFLGYMIFDLQLTSFCIMNAQLFDVSIRAIIATIIIYYIADYVHALAVVWPPSIQYVLIFLHPYIGAHSIFQQAFLYDLAEKDVALFRTIYRHVPQYFLTLVVMLLSCIFYWALAWYLEKVFPGEYGIPLDWNFLFKRDYWNPGSFDNHRKSLSNRSVTITKTASSITKPNSVGTPIVHVNHLVKKFGPDKYAVNNVSFDLYENQITSLLGPNGSGKTTIFNCLIGIYKQTSGTITMESSNGIDYDTRDNIEMLRKSIGYCPQHDILFDLLTIEEQIQFYATARGFRKSKEQISNEMLRLVNLESSKNVYCNALSGGMKRRLSLACAFVGDTKIILLDEPSSGLDPSNRRLLWDWLRSMKEGKTLLLTTHFMEESDALSDRIMIISNGVIKADGTSAKLKEQYGSGYKLVVNKQTNYRTNEIEGELRGYLPQLTVETDIPGGDVVFRTNQQPDGKFIQALRQLEVMKVENRIKTYGVQNSTMDDVFLKITRETKNGNDSGTTATDMEQIDEQCHYVFDEREFFHGCLYYLNQIIGLTIKTLLVHYRRWALTLTVLLLPIMYNILSNIVFQSESERGTFKMQSNSLNPQTILYNADSDIESYFQAAAGSKSKSTKLEKRSENILNMNKYILQKRKESPYTYTDIYLAFEIPAPQTDTYKIQALSSNLISSYEVLSVASDTFYKHAVSDATASIQTILIYKKTANISLTSSIDSAMDIMDMIPCFLKILPLSLLFDVMLFYLIFFYTAVFLISERKDKFLSLLNISGLHPAIYWLFNYVFDIVISVIWFCYLLAIYCLIYVIFNGSPNNRSKSASIIPLEFASSWDLRVQFYPLSILIALPTLPFVYLCTKIFKNDILGGLTICFLLVILHIISIIVPIITMIIPIRIIQNVIYWLFNILAPNINAQVIITYILSQRSKYCKFFASLFDTDIAEPIFKSIGNDTISFNWLILSLHIISFLLILIILDSGLLKISCLSSYQSRFDENALDNDVLAERYRVLNINHSSSNQNVEEEEQETDHLIVHDLVKRYSRRNTIAVNHLTFGAKRGEAFGLLGYNGAGKTTTFRIIVGDETATQGTAYIDGQNVSRRIRSIRQLGYCPQENCSMDFLTVQNGLYLLARIRGVTFSRIHSVVETISSLFLLDPFLKNYIHQLSGGTKRRLHAALALIGPPLVSILDEPTTGVDPHARQQMQEIFLNAVKAKLTIILTSHSMDECERVCNRLGIMFNGQLACLGTIQHLKSKFGQGYTVEIKVRSTSGDSEATAIENIQAFLLSQRQFNVQIREITHSTGSFQIPQGTPADLFELLEGHKQQLNIETYTISQTTLEQIFLSFGKQINATF